VSDGAAPQLLALLDDAAAAGALLEVSSALARALRRDLELVYVESERALVAAALPCTQVLPGTGLRWLPLQPSDIEQGFRAQAARLREMAERIALRDALRCSLRVVRGSLGRATAELGGEADLLLLAPAAPATEAPRSRTPRRRLLVTLLAEDDAPPLRVEQVGRTLAQALDADLHTVHLARSQQPADQPALLQALSRTDVLVCARSPFDAAILARLRCPVVMVS
jgi:hypothetical protein